MGVSGLKKGLGALKPSPVTAGKLAFGLVFSLLVSQFFKISLQVDTKFDQSMDSGYPYIQAVGAHYVNGKPFLEFLSEALVQNTTVVDGVNITEELTKFSEYLILMNSKGEVVSEAGEGQGHDKMLAVPPGGSLVMRYAWGK